VLRVLLIVVILYLPGHFLGSSLVRKGDGLTDLLLLRISASLAVAGPLLTLLALAGWFSIPAIAATLGVCAVVAFLLGGGARTRVRAAMWDLGALAVVVGSFALYARPAEYIINSRDPGVYVLFAEKLARTGALLHRDALVGAVALFHTFLEGKKYPGFYILGQDLIVPQFFPGPFAFLGLGNLAGGLWGSLFVVPLMGALAVGVAFALGKELFGKWAGLAGATLLAASYSQVWWARHPASEVMTQFFVLAGLWLTVRFVRGAGPLTGVLAGLLLGGVMLVRVDAFLASAAVPLLFGYDLLTKGSARRWMYPGIPLVVFAGAALLYLNTVGGRYLYVIYTEHGLDKALQLAPYLAGVALFLSVAFIFVRHRWGGRIGHYLEVRRAWISLGAALCVAAIALWAYFVLPVPWESLPDGSRDFEAYRTQILVRMVWFVTPVVSALGLAGFVLAAYRLDASRALLLGAFLAFGVLYAVIPNVAPDLPWATRRFVPAVFPILNLLAGYAAVEIGKRLGRVWSRERGIAVAGILTVFALGWTIYTALPIIGFRELEGAIGAFNEIERKVPEAEVVYMEMPDGYDITSSTFEYAYNHPVVPYDRIRFIREVDDLEERGLLDDAVYITVHGEPAPLVSGVEFREVATANLKVPRLAAVEKELPREKETLDLTYRVFRIEENR
jgi:dolichyl-phosphate-mannose-protein mannosyltransferase